MKADILEQMYRYYVQMPRYKELRKIYDYDIPKARRDDLKNSMGAENYSKAQEIALPYLIRPNGWDSYLASRLDQSSCASP